MKQKILVFDIETAPMLAYVWGLKDQNIALNQIKKDWDLLAFAAKWLGEKDMIYADRRGKMSEKMLLNKIWHLLDEADIVITQNGKNFDSPKLNARFIMHGMKPPSPYKHLDTYQIVRKVAKFTSNKLEYLTDKLCTKYKKLSHKKFPGFSLWTECLNGNIDAWNEMKRYNIHDVLATEEFYNKIKAWAPAAMVKPFAFAQGCVVCGEKCEKRGFDRKKNGLYQKYHCLSCGHWFQGGKVNG